MRADSSSSASRSDYFRRELPPADPQVSEFPEKGNDGPAEAPIERKPGSRKRIRTDFVFDMAAESISSSAPVVFIIDDDLSLLTSLARLLRASGYAVETFQSAMAFLSRSPYRGPGCVLIDLKLPEVSGLELQQRMTEAGHNMPVIFISGVSDTRSIVSAMQGGALDFLDKPVDATELLHRVQTAISQHRKILQEMLDRRECQMRFARLTSREREVAIHVGNGLSNKEIATTLGTAEKTIKHHRARMMLKLDVRSVAELVRLLDHIGASGRS